MAKWTAVELDQDLVLFVEAEGDALRQAAQELKEYMVGTRRVFSVTFEVDGTEFQCRVWQELCAIPFGEVRSYLDIAKALDKPTATRAVGAANGRNPLPIFIPCHRVIGSDGSLTGFGGGIEVKRALLTREGILL